MENKNMGAYDLKDLIKQAKNDSALAVEKIINMGVENDEILKAILEVAKHDVESTIMSLTYLVGKGNKNAINAIYALSQSYSDISTKALMMLSESNPECKKMLKIIINKYCEIIFAYDNFTIISTIKTLGNIAKSMHDEKIINILIEKLFCTRNYEVRVHIIQILGNIAYETQSKKAIDGLIKSLEFDDGTTVNTINELIGLLEDEKVFKAITQFANRNFSNSRYAMNILVDYIHSYINVDGKKSEVARDVFNSICGMVTNTHSTYSVDALNKLAKSSIKDYLLEILTNNGMIEYTSISSCFYSKNEIVLNQYIENLIRGEVDPFDFSEETEQLIANNTETTETLLKVLQKRADNGDKVSLDLLKIVSAKYEDKKEENMDKDSQRIKVLSEIAKENNKAPIVTMIVINELYDECRFGHNFEEALNTLLSINSFDNREIKKELKSALKDLLQYMDDHRETEKIASRLKELNSVKMSAV